MRWFKKTPWQGTEGTVASLHHDPAGDEEVTTAVFTYKVDGHWYSGTITSSGYFQGQKIRVLYDPDDPNRNRLVERDRQMYWLLGTVVAILLVAGLIVSAR